MAYSGEKDSLLSLFQSKHSLSAASLFLFCFVLVLFVVYMLLDVVIGLRVKEDVVREGLDVTSHGEKAYSH